MPKQLCRICGLPLEPDPNAALEAAAPPSHIHPPPFLDLTRPWRPPAQPSRDPVHAGCEDQQQGNQSRH